MPGPATKYPKSKINELRKLWETTTHSAAVLGKMFGMSKNAVIGLANRQGFKSRAHLQPQAIREARKAAVVDHSLPPLIDHPVFGKPTGRCRWIHERLSYGVYRYCEQGSYNLSSWCPEHEKVVFIRGKCTAAEMERREKKRQATLARKIAV